MTPREAVDVYSRFETGYLSEQHAPRRTLEFIWSIEITILLSCILIKLVRQFSRAKIRLWACFQQQIRVRVLLASTEPTDGHNWGYKWRFLSSLSRLVQLSAFNWLVPFLSCTPRTLDNSIMAAVPLDASAAPNTQASLWLPSNTSSSTKRHKICMRET